MRQHEKEVHRMDMQKWAKGWLSDFTPAGIQRTIDTMYADKVHFEDVVIGHKASTSKGIGEFFSSFASGKTKHRFVVTKYAGDESSGAMEWTWYADHVDDIMGVAANGKKTEVRGISYIRLENGRIVEERDYWDAATLMRQLGALPAV
jgi:steroid delta-isomerase-like uncharacterized protein